MTKKTDFRLFTSLSRLEKDKRIENHEDKATTFEKPTLNLEPLSVIYNL